MTTFVLVHGLGLGGWCWRRSARHLRNLGHDVLTPTLTGVGERSHLANRDIDLNTHVEDVCNVLRWEGLSNVTLVGHSYGGAVITGVADREAERIRCLLYLDAFILRDGESVISKQPPERAKHYEHVCKEQGDGWLVPPNPAEFYGLDDPHDCRWVDDNSVPHPYATLTQPLSLTREGPTPFVRSYLFLSGFQPSPFVQFAERVRDDESWRYGELHAGHMAMVSHPRELASALLELAE